ncbi:ammonium transporter [Pseudonocardia thermophila]|uniref:Ammonium transporter n=1 Tax=Pseudonocardia thermophila TaxID=1848 RepID=A0A1M6PA36_PSETH|nr:ammonium transporter [Pseudonocardia thermophila]SHK04815.1 ammonium transporter [Pseudonocardia thermophila]
MTAATGDTAWVLVAAALVMLMTPGVAFFYGGMVRARSVLNTLMMTVVCLPVVGVVWAVVGFDLTFGDDAGLGVLGLIGRPGSIDPAGLVGSGDATTPWPGPHALPVPAFAMFQLMFAALTAAVVAGAVVERTRFWAWTVFVALWSVLVYAPVGHWVFAADGLVGPASRGGWINNQVHAVDFAGGTVVHINAGAAALALAIVLGRRRGWPTTVARPHHLPFTMLGAGLLWFGWYGFNAGSALSAGPLAAIAFANTTFATCTAVLGWLIVEQLRTGRPTSLGAASGAVARLVAITPACGYVDTWGALAIGLVAGIVCPLACAAKWRIRLDDSLDVVAIHLVGGLVGTLLVGVFARRSVNPDALDVDGVVHGGDATQLLRQAVAAGAVFGYSFVVTLLLGYLIRFTIGFRVPAAAEATGLDLEEHAETAYEPVERPTGRHRDQPPPGPSPPGSPPALHRPRPDRGPLQRYGSQSWFDVPQDR